MPRISVVVPIYNVERYLEECLESIARQTVSDLEVLMVDDGSTDGSAAIARRFAEADPRFRLITQPNAGLGAARNTGAAAATGEYLAFVDSDDALPHHAYERLLTPLEKTGSDFATGNVLRLTPLGTRQARFLTRTFERRRLKTHVKRFRPLLADRIVPNKLWRRSFWEHHGLRFPEGVLHEDIPVVVPAQFLARSVDVVPSAVYYYRIREAAVDRSITQRRAELKALQDRLSAVEHVSRFLREHREWRGKRWYDASVVAEDLRYYLNVLDVADDSYREVFLERVNAFLDTVGRHVYRGVPAIERLKWHLVRRRLLPELLEVLRFQKEELDVTPPVRGRRHWYGDFPFRDDPRLKVPSRVYRLDHDFTMASRIDGLRCVDGRLEVSGWAYISWIGAPERDTQRVSVTALRHGRLQRLRLRTTAVRFDTVAARRPDATAVARQEAADLEWSGFVATLDPRRLRRLGRWRDGTWELYVTVRAGSARRRRWRFVDNPLRPLRAVELPSGSAGVGVRACQQGTGELVVRIVCEGATLRSAELADGAVELRGDLRGVGDGAVLRLARPDGAARLEVPLRVEGGRFAARVDPAALPADVKPIVDVHTREREDGIHWELHVVAGGRDHRVALAAETPEAAWRVGDGELALVRTREGDASLAQRTARATVTAARWTGDDELELAGESRLPAGPYELVLAAVVDPTGHAFAVQLDAEGRFAARIAPARLPSLDGDRPLRRGRWRLELRAAPASDGHGRGVPVMLSEELHGELPIATVVAHKPYALGIDEGGRALLAVERDHDPDERGRYHQRRLRRFAYEARRGEPLRDVVVYSSFRGRQYSDNPRAIHEELVRRGAPLEHLWVVYDGMCRVPDTARAIRRGSREHHEALATARYIVDNDHFSAWFQRRDDQVSLQTWHGTPLKRLGFDVPETLRAARGFERNWDVQVRNWQYVLSPNRFSTPILRDAFALEGEMLETGYPRADALAGPGRDAAGAALRARLGLPAGARVVLYAPTFRDHVVGDSGRYRFDLHLDVERLRAALGDDTILLIRPHHYVADVVPTRDGTVRDMTTFPDGTELLLAADVLITDYSSMMFDFAATGRPMLFFTYDLELYEQEVRGLYFDLAAQAPGPLLRTTDEVAEALRDLDTVAAAHADRYARFAATFCEFDDGHAAERVVDRVFEL